MREASHPAVAVIVVNYNGGAFLRRCMDALAKQTFRDFRTILVDNGSTDSSLDGIETCPGQLDVVRAGRNLGFAAGNNLGLKSAGDARWIVLLNPDAFPAPDWLQRLVHAALGNPEFEFFGCRMRFADAPEILDGTGDCYHVSGASWRRDHGAPIERGAVHPGEIFGPCAAAAMYSREILTEVGGFDERYFCYHEDVDLAFRLRLRGHRCLYVPDAIVDHVSSGISGRRSDFATYHGHRNLVWTYVKNMPDHLFWLYLPLHVLLTIISIAVCAGRGQLGVILRAKRDALVGLRATWRERRVVQEHRTVPANMLRRVMARGLRPLWRRTEVES